MAGEAMRRLTADRRLLTARRKVPTANWDIHPFDVENQEERRVTVTIEP